MAIPIVTLSEINVETEHIKGYYDEQGLDMNIAVVELTSTQSSVVVSTKHWSTFHYITTDQSPEDCWKTLFEISTQIGRTLIKSAKGKYVYIHKLNLTQTQSIFDILKNRFGNNITKAWEMKWDIRDSVMPNVMQSVMQSVMQQRTHE